MALKHKQYFFIHIPKTAGTSFRAMLHENFDSNEIYPAPTEIKNKDKPYSNLGFIKSQEQNFFKKYKLINGHYPYLMSKQFGDPFTIAFLRCPIKRTISNILHFKSYIKKFRKVPIIEVLNSLPLIQTSNAYVRYLSTNLNTSHPLKPGNLKKAMDNLDNIDFVGTLENYSEDIKKLNKITNLKLDSSITKNINKKTYKISAKVYKEIITRNQLDLILYHKYLYNNK